MAAVPAAPEPNDWLAAAIDELKQGDKATLALLQESYRNINKILQGLPNQPDAAFGDLVYRAQLERTRKALLDEQAKLFDRLGDKVAARRLRSASRAAKLSAASDAALLRLVGDGAEGERLYAGATITAQRTVETILARQGMSKVPLSERIYNTSVWMHKRLDTLIASTLARGLNAQRFAKVARDWFSPSVPGGTRYAAMRLARTEINNAFHATSIDYAKSKPWVSQMDWHLSKSHPAPDKCNPIAAASPYDVHLVPRKPHPQCMCYVTERTPDEDEWIDRFVAGEFDDYLDKELAKADHALGFPMKTQKTSVKQNAKKIAATPVAKPKPEPEPEPEIKPEPQPKPASDGYSPGAWVLQSDKEAAIQEIERGLLKLLPPDQQHTARKLAEELISETSDSSELEFRNGPHSVRFTGKKLTEEQRQTFLSYVDQLQTRTPAGRKMHINVAPSSEFEVGVGGETTLSTGYMRINEDVLRRPVWPGMPVSSKVSSALYVLAHEWGHAFPDKDDARNQSAHDHSVAAGGMTGYGKTAPAEGYAEAFAEWVLTNGQTTNKAAQEYAKRFKWGERFGI